MYKADYDMIVVGGGPGGYTAALYGARAGLSVLVLEMLSPGGQMATTENVDNYPGFPEGADGFELGEKMQQGAHRFGAVTKFEEVKALHLEETPKRVETGKGVYTARTVVLSTGANPRRLAVPGEEALAGRGVAYCATCDGMYYRGKEVAVLGGGNSAAEEALYLSKICPKVYLVHRRDTLRAEKSSVQALQRAGNIEFVWNATVEGFVTGGERGSLQALVLKSTQDGHTWQLPCEGAFVAIGRVPNTALVAGKVQLDAQGYVAADETTRTSAPGVFAVGDVRTKAVRQIVTAAADGAVAAHFAQEFIEQQA